MGHIQIRKLTPADELWLCDNCNQEGVRANGYEVLDSFNEIVLWVCYTCKHRLYKGKFDD